MTRAKGPRGIRRTAEGTWQVFVKRDGQYRSRRFPASTSLTDLKREREKLIGEIVHKLTAPADVRSFAQDAADYLALVTAMPSYSDRAYRIQLWVEAFGPRERKTITAREIAAVLERWRTTGSFEGKGLSNASLNQRRTALLAMYTTLDGRSAANVVRDVKPYRETSGDEDRSLPIPVWYRLLARIGKKPRKGRRPANRGRPRRRSKTRARLRLILWTGLPHQLIQGLTAQDIDWTGGRIRVGRRKKGAGTPGRWIPVVPPAVTALREFAAAEAWGRFSPSAMHSSLARAVAAENIWRARWGRPTLTPVRPLDARHTFAAELAKVVHDDWMLDAFLVSKQRRYREGAKEQRMREARDRFARALQLPATSGTPSGPLQTPRPGRRPSGRASGGSAHTAHSGRN